MTEIKAIMTAEEARNAVERELISVTGSYGPRELYEPIDYALESGGKRIRPLMVLLGCELFDGDISKAIDPAIAAELFHNFTLLHDDIMDNAPIRRGKPTVCRKWNDNTAILSGDTLFVLAYERLAKSDKEKLPELLDVFTKTAREVCEGQQLDMNFESRNDVTIPEYLGMIRLKTAVLLGCCLKIGAVVAGAAKDEAEKAYSFGQNTGLAFQLMDDLLDTYGDSATFGKETGGDIACNKKTFLYVQAMETAGAEGKKELQALYSGEHYDIPSKITAVRNIFDRYDIREKTESMISYYSGLAMKDLESINVPEEKKIALKELEAVLLKRKY